MSGWDAWSRSNEATTICSGCAIHHKFPFSGMSMPTPPHRKRSKKLRPLVQEVATAFPEAQVELWATDEHRIGLKPILRRVWAPKGHLPIAPVQPRYEWRYLVGFVHPASGRTIFHHATSVSIPLSEAELAAFARQVGVSPKKKIVLVQDRAGWHTSLRLRVPNHVYLHFLPSYSPELQPAEHLWPLTNAPLINRHFSSIEDLEEAQAQHRVALQAQPALVRSTTLFHWWPQRHSVPTNDTRRGGSSMKQYLLR